jgi:hypothetical protein
MKYVFNKKNSSNIQYLDKFQSSTLNVLDKDKDKYSSNKVDMSFLSDYIKWEKEKENERLISEYFRLIKVDEMVSGMIILMTLASCLTYHEAKICTNKCIFNEGNKSDIISLSLIFVSLSTTTFLIVLIIKYYHYFLLYRNAKYIQPYKNFFQTSLLKYFIIEFIFAILHPNVYFNNKNFITSVKFNLQKVIYDLNDIFTMTQFMRLIYIIANSSIYTDFYGAKTDRICKMMSKQLDLFFGFRALFIRHTAPVLIFSFCVICLMLGYMLKILSEPMQYPFGKTSFEKLGNCIWYVFVTMTTVGYGDMYPNTTAQRIIGCIIATAGTVLIALLVTFLQDLTTLTSQEKDTLNFLTQVELRKRIMADSAQYFKDNMLYVINKKKMENGTLKYNEINKDKIIRLFKNKIESRDKFKNRYHQFHIKFNIGQDIDRIKEKIARLDYVSSDLAKNIDLIYKEIIELINLLSDDATMIIDKDKKIKSEGNINFTFNNRIESGIESIKEIDESET